VTLLQSGSGAVHASHYLTSEPDQVHWGLLPNALTAPVLTIGSGETVCIDTVSHEGILDDQGRDPVGFFASYGIPADRVLHDAIAIAASALHYQDETVGPHVVTGPIAVKGARVGDVLEVEVLTLERRAPYGIISNRHGKGALPGEMPLGDGPVCVLATTEGESGVIAVGDGRSLRFPLAPFLGIMGVAPATVDAVNSVPPGRHGGNLDVNLFGVGSQLYLPVQVDQAMFYVSDPHFSQGDGEVALTAFEAPLRATVRLTVHSDEAIRVMATSLTAPWGQTPDLYVTTGLDPDLDAAMRDATRNALAFLSQRFDLPAPIALAYLSAAADFEISQVVDGVKGVHCSLRRADLDQLS
jgi:acetamidase/formamidase